MALLKDKQKVLGEVFDEERIKTFLDFTPPKNINPEQIKDFQAALDWFKKNNAEAYMVLLD